MSNIQDCKNFEEDVALYDDEKLGILPRPHSRYTHVPHSATVS